MPQPLYRFCLLALGLGFAIAFCVIVVPPLWASRDVFGALAAGFVNPYASGYSLDTICCWCVLRHQCAPFFQMAFRICIVHING